MKNLSLEEKMLCVYLVIVFLLSTILLLNPELMDYWNMIITMLS